MSTTVTGKMVMPDGTPIAGAVITAYLNDFGAESNSLEVYPSNIFITTTSDSTGLWSLSLWPSSGSVTSTKYTFSIQANSLTIPKEYMLEVPNQPSILFSDLLAGFSTRDIANELLDNEPATYDMTIHRGATFYREFLFEDGRNEPINLTGYTARMQAVDIFSTVITTIANITLTADGYIKVSIPATTTATLLFDTAQYDLALLYSDKVYKVLQGTLTIKGTITDTLSANYNSIVVI